MWCVCLYVWCVWVVYVVCVCVCVCVCGGCVCGARVCVCVLPWAETWHSEDLEQVAVEDQYVQMQACARKLAIIREVLGRRHMKVAFFGRCGGAGRGRAGITVWVRMGWTERALH